MTKSGDTCLDRFQKIMKFTRTIAAICGGDILRKNYKMNIITWMVIIAINCYFCCTIYTIYIGFVVNGDWKIILQTLSLSGSAIQGYSTLILGIQKRSLLRDMYEKLHSIYEEYQRDEEFLEVLRYRTQLTTKILKTVLIIYASLVFILIGYPAVYGQLYGEKLLIMSFYLPGIDPASNAGHLAHNAVHALLIALGGFGNFAGDMYIFILIIHVPLFKDILKIKCEKLNKIIVATDGKVEETMPMVKDILLWHQSYNIYAQNLDQAYYGVIFIQIFTSVVSISCTLFSIIINTWPAAFAYLIYCFIMMYCYCGLGHLVEMSNDEVIGIIYGNCLWYELSIPEQKLVRFMLHKSHVPTTLTIGQIMPLSMSSALQLTKAIYSYMMMLVNFLD